MIPPSFDYAAPESLDEAIRLLAAHGEEARPLAGGHSLLPLLKLRLASPGFLIDLRKISALRGIGQEGDRIVIGALTTHYQIESSALLKEKCPLLPETAALIGDVQVRNRGTIGGSLAHADPAADLPAAILALDGEIAVVGKEGERRVRGEEFFLGIMTTALRPGEILTAIRVPVLSAASAYHKFAQQASGFAIVGVAAWVKMRGRGVFDDVGIGVTGLGARPFRAQRVEERLRGERLRRGLIHEASSRVTEGVDPLDDIHAPADFRAHLARLCTARAVRAALDRCGNTRDESAR